MVFEPVARVQYAKTGGNAGLTWHAAPIDDITGMGLPSDGTLLYVERGLSALPRWQLLPAAHVRDLLASQGNRLADESFVRKVEASVRAQNEPVLVSDAALLAQALQALLASRDPHNSAAPVLREAAIAVLRRRLEAST